MQRTIAFAFCALALVFVGSARADTKMIYAGTLLAVPGQEPLKEQTIIIKDGRIAEVRAGYILPVSGQRVFDLRNQFVLPGLIDCHVHLLGELSAKAKVERTEDGEAFVALRGAMYAIRTLRAGFTTVRDLGERSDAIFALRRAIQDGMIAGPRILAAGAIISPTGGHGQTYGYREDINAIFASSGVCDGVEGCRRAVRLQVARGADVIKFVATGGVLSDIKAGVDQQFADDEMASIIQTAHRLGRQVAAHAHGDAGINAALRAGVDSIEHGSYLSDESISLFKKSGAYLVPTVIAGVTAAEFARTGGFMSEAQKAKALRVGPIIQSALRKAYAGGVKIAFGTDSGVSAHGQNAKEFSLMIGAGMPAAEAIKAATVNAADLLQLGNQIGTIEPGKAADIIAVGQDPTRDIKTLERVQFVMRAGAVYVGQ